MARQTKKEQLLKIEILDIIVEELKAISTPNDNKFTLNNLLEMSNKKFVKLGLKTLSPNSLKGKDVPLAYQKYQTLVKKFKNEMIDSRNFISNSSKSKIKELKSKVEDLLVQLVSYQDKYMELEKDYNDLVLLNKKIKNERDTLRERMSEYKLSYLND
ncbi:hypothetical protein L5F09_02675 [Aliarcobacter butzleri]|uniref:hypothetical protein n=1 Tax=Aliarcobacter butzleri TaxID=28197 RepID=UPI001EDC8D44|nr:hypothetical protein [Aliarcobacter butzleri]MCG3664646.1 hypothetical protein [Aliarcobacter butzleri]